MVLAKHHNKIIKKLKIEQQFKLTVDGVVLYTIRTFLESIFSLYQRVQMILDTASSQLQPGPWAFFSELRSL